MRYKDLKIKTKLVSGFSIVAAITAIVAAVGYYTVVVLSGRIYEIAEVRLPSIESLLVISEAQTAVDSAENLLLYAKLANEDRNFAYQRFDEAERRYKAAWKIYEPLPQTEEEARVWKEFVVAWEAWWKDHLQYVELVKAYEAEKSDAKYEKMAYQAITVNGGSFKKAEKLLNRLVEINDEVSKSETAASEAEAHKASIAMVAFGVSGVLLALLIGITIANTISKPIQKIVEASKKIVAGDIEKARIAEAIAAGDLSVTVSATSASDLVFDDASEDEVGQLISSFVEISKAQETLGRAFESMTKNLNEVLGEVSSGSEQVASGAVQISDASQSLSQGATEQAASLEQITSSMSEIGSQTRTNAENAGRANSFARETKAAADAGSERMKDMVEAMNDISSSSSHIARIIKAIDDIAFQTNLLALNAAVEAARAGKHGKGFAVVADEVRNLAGRSAKAARETSELIEASTHKVENGLQVAVQTSESFGQIVGGIVKVADLVGEISSACNEQAQGIQQINQGLGQIDQVTQQSTANAEETASAAEELTGQATQLQAMLKRFKLAGRAGREKPQSFPVREDQMDSTAKKASPSKWGAGKPSGPRAASKRKTPQGAAEGVSADAIIRLDDDSFGRY